MKLLRGKIISVSGIDGSGKTTCIEHLRTYYNAEGWSTRYIWLRYNHYLTKVLLILCRVMGLTHYQQVGDTRVGYHDFYRSKLISHLFIGLTLLDTFLVSLVLVYIPAVFSRSVIICDRWIPDILIDLEIDTHMSLVENSIYGAIFWALMPDTTKIIVVQRGYNAVLHARAEHKVDKNFQRRFQLYAKLAKFRKVRAIDNSGSIQDAVNLVCKAVAS